MESTIVLNDNSLLMKLPRLAFMLKTDIQDWRDGLAIKSTGSSRGPRFDSQHPHGRSQLSVTPVPGHLTATHRHAGKAAVHIK